jgi:hypothetical protein
MALGALIGAYQEDDAGGLKALSPLAGRTLVEYQARCAAAAGAAPIVVLVERVPPALAAAFERLRAEGVAAIPVSDGIEAAARFEPGMPILQMADGIAPAMTLVQRVVEADEPAVATVPDDQPHELFERIDNERRWAGLALVDANTLSSTAAMLGDWDLQSTLLRRTIQAGALFIPAGGGVTPFLVHSGAEPQAFDRHLIQASRRIRRDWPSRYLLPLPEEFATEQLMGTPVRPAWLIAAALILMLAAAVAFVLSWPLAAIALLLLASPLDLIAERLAILRLRPLPAGLLTRRLLWPAAGLALLAIGWFEARDGSGWGAAVLALAAAAFAEAARVEARGRDLPGETWLFGLRPAIFLTVPFALGGWWTAALAVLAVYAAGSFFLVQNRVHGAARD